MLRRVESWRVTDFAVKRSASISRFRQSKKTAFFWLFLDCPTMKMKALRPYETPVTIRQSTRRSVSEHSNLHYHRWINSRPSLHRLPLAAVGVITVNSGFELSVTGTHRYSGENLWSWPRSWWSLITFHWSPSVKYSVYKELRVEYMHSSNQLNTTQNSILHNRINSPSPEMNVLPSSVFLIGMHPLLFTNIRPSDFSCKVTVVLLSNQLYQFQVTLLPLVGTAASKTAIILPQLLLRQYHSIT
jgi:hypothetical protein